MIRQGISPAMNSVDIFKRNKELNEEEIKRSEIILKSKPRMLRLILTTRCNLKCIMCLGLENPSTLPFEVLEKIDCLYPYLEQINWQGGEVFLVDYFKKLFQKASSYPQIRHSIITNGLLIDEEWAELLVQNNVYLSYSIDAVIKETYEYIRRGASFDDLIKSISIINRYKKKGNNGVTLMLNVVVMKSNYRQLQLFPEFCKRYNFTHLRFEYLRPEAAPEEDIFTIRKDEEALGYLKNAMPGIEDKCKGLGIEIESCLRPFLDNNTHASEDNIDKSFSSPEETTCKFPWKQLLIDTGKGDIRPDCLCVRSLGNIFDNTIEELWNNEMMQEYRRRILNKTLKGYCAEACVINATGLRQREGI